MLYKQLFPCECSTRVAMPGPWILYNIRYHYLVRCVTCDCGRPIQVSCVRARSSNRRPQKRIQRSVTRTGYKTQCPTPWFAFTTYTSSPLATFSLLSNTHSRTLSRNDRRHTLLIAEYSLENNYIGIPPPFSQNPKLFIKHTPPRTSHTSEPTATVVALSRLTHRQRHRLY